jgi:hypothetical protein
MHDPVVELCWHLVAPRFVRVVPEAHHDVHLGTEGSLVVLDRLLAAAAEEQVRLHARRRHLADERIEAAQNMRLASIGMVFGSMPAMRGSAMALALTSSRCARER